VATSHRIVLGVSGGIAAFKAAGLVSRLCADGDEVRVVMSEAATRFVTPLTFQSLSGNPVAIDTFDRSHSCYQHIELAEWGQLMILAPATANIIGKAVCGIADDILSTSLLSFSGQLLVAPAMNTRMWEHPAVQENVKKLCSRRVTVVGPASGRLACGEQGLGRMAEIEDIIEAARGILTK
jgi:phosphopantothenoylcysteine decarboxylase / phosphopantothenate---cysteine ligase